MSKRLVFLGCCKYSLFFSRGFRKFFLLFPCCTYGDILREWFRLLLVIFYCILCKGKLDSKHVLRLYHNFWFRSDVQFGRIKKCYLFKKKCYLICYLFSQNKLSKLSKVENIYFLQKPLLSLTPLSLHQKKATQLLEWLSKKLPLLGSNQGRLY